MQLNEAFLQELFYLDIRLLVYVPQNHTSGHVTDLPNYYVIYIGGDSPTNRSTAESHDIPIQTAPLSMSTENTIEHPTDPGKCIT